MYTTIERWDDDYGIPLPQSLLDQIGLEEDDTLEIVIMGEEIILRKAGASGKE